MVLINKLALGIILSMLPFSELRGGIPLMINSGFNPWSALFLGFIVNIAIIFPLWFFLDYLHGYFLNFKLYKKFSEKIIEKARAKSKHVAKNMQTYGFLALSLFVAIPLPVTGAYTGSLIAWILGLEKKKSFWFISLGVFIAASIVTLLTLGIFLLRH